LGLYESAITTFEKVLELDPENADAHNNLGTVYMAKGWWKKALEEFTRATTANPNHALAHLNLSIVYALHERDEIKARYHLDRCRSINPHSPQLKQVEKELSTHSN
jgi:tetratricopeptide (TPR) repeat protein